MSSLPLYLIPMLNLILYVIASYLLGSIPFAIAVCYLFKGVDVRKHGSGNAGATNVYRVAGPFAAILAGLLDVAKGALPVLAARAAFPGDLWLQILCGLAAVVGHIFPVFVGFRGGKGINALLGMLLVLLPLEMLICLAIFGLTFALSRIVSIGSLIAGVSLSLIVVIEKYAIGKNVPFILVCTCLLVSLLVIFTHRANIKRLFSGQEDKLSRR